MRKKIPISTNGGNYLHYDGSKSLPNNFEHILRGNYQGIQNLRSVVHLSGVSTRWNQAFNPKKDLRYKKFFEGNLEDCQLFTINIYNELRIWNTSLKKGVHFGFGATKSKAVDFAVVVLGERDFAPHKQEESGILQLFHKNEQQAVSNIDFSHRFYRSRKKK